MFRIGKHAKSLQSGPTLCNPMDCSPPGSCLHGILLARILEWVATPFSRGSSQPRDRSRLPDISCIGGKVLYYWHHLGRPVQVYTRFLWGLVSVTWPEPLGQMYAVKWKEHTIQSLNYYLKGVWVEFLFP